MIFFFKKKKIFNINKKQMEEIQNQLKKNRPNLTESTLKTYTSILNNLYKKMNGSGTMLNYFENNLDKVMDTLKEDKKNVRKTKMAVLVSLFSHKDKVNGLDKLRETMLKDANDYNASLREQQMTEKMKENWMSMGEINEIFKEMYKRSYPLLKKTKLTKQQFNEVLLLVMLSLYILNPPRRSQDFALMKIRNYDKEKDNYYDGKLFTFQKYKTSKVYGDQVVKVNPKLNTILKLWLKLNPHDYLLTSYDGKPLSVSRMTLLFNRIFGKNISTSMIRHIFLSEQYKDVPALKEMDQTARDMGHSTREALETYVKKK